MSINECYPANDSISSSSRKQTFTERFDQYFTQDDEYDEHSQFIDAKNITLIDRDDVAGASMTSSLFNYQWEFRHTLSYWVAINYILGALLFTTGSFFWLIEDRLTTTDFYCLVTVAFFAGACCFTMGTYFAYYEVINEQTQSSRRKRIFCCYAGKRNINFYAVLTYFIGTICYQLNTTTGRVFYTIRGVLKMNFTRGSLTWYLLLQMPIFFGGLCFWVGAMFEMHLNKAWKWRPTKLSWIVCWLNGVGGFTFFMAGIGLFFEDQPLIILWMTIIPYLFGSFCYFLGGIGSLWMWKLNQFGLCHLPQLNTEHHLHRTEKRKGKNIVLYRDIFFLCFYVVTLATAITCIAYASICVRYGDWIKNFALALVASIVILAMGSFVHREPERAPVSYLLWFLRFFMIIYTINLMVDGYHLSGNSCYTYGEHDYHP
eukprot:467168_1